jgi:hypothetical protein
VTRRNEKAELLSQVIGSLANLGIRSADITALRGIAKQMHKWDELECGDANGNCIERDEATGIPYMTSEPHNFQGPRLRQQIPDTEAKTENRLRAVMAKYPDLVAYHQGDCRGWPLYIMRRTDLAAGERIDSVYNRGAGIPGQLGS